MLAKFRDKLRQWHLPGSPSGDLPIWGEVLAGGCGGASQVHSDIVRCFTFFDVFRFINIKLKTHKYMKLYVGDVHESSGDC